LPNALSQDLRDCIELSLSHFHVAYSLFIDERYMHVISNLYYSVYNMCRVFILLKEPIPKDEDTHGGIPRIYARLYNTNIGTCVYSSVV